MKFLNLSILPSNRPDYVDLFLNHSELGCLPWLIAHNHLFFGGLHNLSILDVLLKYRRGFNCQLGSKVRKRYFSDVNRILLSCGEFRISLIESFSETTSYVNSVDYKNCGFISFSVSEVEEISISDSGFNFNPPPQMETIPNIDFEGKNRMIKFTKKTSVLSPNDDKSKLVSELLKIFKKCKHSVLEHKEELEKERAGKNDLAKKIKMNIDDLNSRMRKIIRVTLDSDLFNNSPEKDIIKVIEDVKIFFEADKVEFINCFQDAKEAFIHYKKSSMSASSKRELKSQITTTLTHKNFKFLSEIKYFCDGLELDSREGLVNWAEEKVNEERKSYEEAKSSGKSTKLRISEIKSEENRCKRERARINDERESLEWNLKHFSDPEELCNPIAFSNFEASLNQLHEITAHLIDDDFKFDELTNVCEQLILDLRRRMERKSTSVKVLELKGKIKSIYDQNREVYLKSLDETDVESEDGKASELFFPHYMKIVALRREYIASLNFENLNFEDLGLNSHETDKINEIVPILKKDYRTFLSCSSQLENEKTTIIDDKTNREISFRREGVNPDLNSEDWGKEVFKSNEKFLRKRIESYEKASVEFESIVGLPPEGIVNGEMFEEMTREERCKELEKMAEESVWEMRKMGDKSSYLDKVLINLKKAKLNGPESLTEVDSGYLYQRISDLKTVEGGRNAYNIKINDKLQEEKRVLMEKLSILEKPTVEEEIMSLAVQQVKEPRKEIIAKGGLEIKWRGPGRKIEEELKTKTISRKKSSEIFKEFTRNSVTSVSNKFDALEVEEIIQESDQIVDKLFESDLVPYMLTDVVRRQSRRVKKLKLKEELQFCDKDEKLKRYSQFEVNQNGKSNKKYDVTNCVSYIKVLLALRMMKINVKRNIYEFFGFKKCQSDYLRKELIRMAIRMLNSGEVLGFKVY